MMRISQSELKSVSKKVSSWDMAETNTKDSLQVMFKVLSFLDLSIFKCSPSNCILVPFTRHLFPIFAHVIVLDVAVMFTGHMKYDLSTAKTNTAYIVLCILSLIVWHVLYKKRKAMGNVYESLRNISRIYSMSDVPKACSIKIILFFVCTLFTVAIISFVLFEDAAYFCRIFSYHVWNNCDISPVGRIYVFIKAFGINAIAVLFTIDVAFFYCLVCYRCSSLLEKYRKRVEEITKSSSYHLLEPKLGKDYQDLIQIVENIQSMFSLPTLLVFLISFMHGFISLARFMIFPDKETTLFFMIEHFIFHIPTAFFTLLIPFFAAQVSKEMALTKAEFNRMYEKMSFHSDVLRNRKSYLILTTLKDMLTITLSAWDMIEFTGTTIPSVLGTFITYGLLILNINR